MLKSRMAVRTCTELTWMVSHTTILIQRCRRDICGSIVDARARSPSRALHRVPPLPPSLPPLVLLTMTRDGISRRLLRAHMHQSFRIAISHPLTLSLSPSLGSDLTTVGNLLLIFIATHPIVENEKTTTKSSRLSLGRPCHCPTAPLFPGCLSPPSIGGMGRRWDPWGKPAAYVTFA